VFAESLGLSRADSTPNLTRRLDARLRTSPGLAHELEQIMAQIRSQTVRPQTPDPAPPVVEASDASKKSGRRRTKNKV
jgi:hypothetical protein